MQQLSLSAKVSAMCISFCFSFFLPNFGRSSTLFVHTVYNYPLPWQTFFAISFCFSFFLHNFGRSSALFVHTVYNYPMPWQTFFAISFFFSFLFAQLEALKWTLCAYYTQLQLNKYRIFLQYHSPFQFLLTIKLLAQGIMSKILQSPCVRKKAGKDFFTESTKQRETLLNTQFLCRKGRKLCCKRKTAS